MLDCTIALFRCILPVLLCALSNTVGSRNLESSSSLGHRHLGGVYVSSNSEDIRTLAAVIGLEPRPLIDDLLNEHPDRVTVVLPSADAGTGKPPSRSVLP